MTISEWQRYIFEIREFSIDFQLGRASYRLALLPLSLSPFPSYQRRAFNPCVNYNELRPTLPTPFIMFTVNYFVQHSRQKCDFGGSLTDGEVIDSSIDDVFVDETWFHPLEGEVTERSVVSVKEVTNKSEGW